MCGRPGPVAPAPAHPSHAARMPQPPGPDIDERFARIVADLDVRSPYRPLWVGVLAVLAGAAVVFAFGGHLVLGAAGLLLVAAGMAWVSDRLRDLPAALLARYRRHYARMLEEPGAGPRT